MRIGSLFSGIGGLELGLERAGLGHVVWQVERDPFARTVLAAHWPHVDRSVEDVREAHSGGAGSGATLARVAVICGGFPCQDVSSAGAGRGLDGARSGLWYEFARIVGELRPRYVIVENVASGASRWLCPVRTGLHQLGYSTAAYAVSAADVGAPHRRRRIFVVAYSADIGCHVGTEGGALVDGRERGRGEDDAQPDHGGAREVAHADRERLRVESERLPGGRAGDVRGSGHAESAHDGGSGRVADAHGIGCGTVGVGASDDGLGPAHGLDVDRRGGTSGGEGDAWPDAQPRVGGDAARLPRGLDGGPAVRPLHRWPARPGHAQRAAEPARACHPGPYAEERLSTLGNAVVPQCAEVVGRIVLEHARTGAWPE